MSEPIPDEFCGVCKAPLPRVYGRPGVLYGACANCAKWQQLKATAVTNGRLKGLSQARARLNRPRPAAAESLPLWESGQDKSVPVGDR